MPNILNYNYLFDIQQTLIKLQRQGQSCRGIAKTLALNRGTVVKYLAMSETKYEGFLGEKESLANLLGSFELFVKDRLLAHPAASAAQVHDWLKGNYKRFPFVSAKTVYNFVMAIRQKYSVTLVEASREYFVVAELPNGLQAQADFDQYILRNADEKRKKVHFFVMMLSRSRKKLVRFSVTSDANFLYFLFSRWYIVYPLY